MELGTPVPQRLTTRFRIVLGSVCVLLGLIGLLAFSDVFDGFDGARHTTEPTSPISTLRVPNGSTRKGHALFCVDYEVCKCITTSTSENAYCQPETCRFAPAAPYQCCEGYFCVNPHCTKAINTWEDCEWANFPDPTTQQRAEGQYPGEGLFTDVPRVKHYSRSSFAQGAVVFTDVDDTMKCSGGHGGVDTTCAGTSRGNLYAGVAEFMLGLARGPADTMNPTRVVPLSARPDELKLFLAMSEGSKEAIAFESVGAASGVTWGLDTDNAQYGSIYDLRDIAPGPWGDTDLTAYDKMGYRKYTNWEKVRTMWGKVTVFVGDNGQGDTVAAQMMLKRSAAIQSNAEGPMRMVFIHDVRNLCPEQSACFSKYWPLGIVMFSDYGRAADFAKYLGLMSMDSCVKTCAAVKQKQYSKCACSLR